MTRRLPVLLCAIGVVALLSNCGDPETAAAPDAGTDASIPVLDSGSETPDDAGAASDAGTAADAGQEAADAGTDAGSSPADAGALEYCGSPTLTPGRDFTVTLNDEAVDFSGDIFWGTFIPGDSSYYAEATFTWASVSGEYYLTLSVLEGFSGTCPATISLPDDHVSWNFFGESAASGESIDLFSSTEGASGTLRLDAYDLAGEACSVSVDCENCRFTDGIDVAVVDGQAAESCQ